MEQDHLIELTADIVAAHVGNNSVAIGDVGNLVQRVHEALTSLGAPAPEAAPEKKQPAVSVRTSVKPEYIVCLDCGTKHKMLKRHLQNAHGVTPAQYRAEFGLNNDYPMVAPDYSERRRALAHSIGLGRRREAPAADAKPTAAPRGRRKKADATAV